MKKTISLLLCFLTVFCFAGCKKNSETFSSYYIDVPVTSSDSAADTSSENSEKTEKTESVAEKSETKKSPEKKASDSSSKTPKLTDENGQKVYTVSEKWVVKNEWGFKINSVTTHYDCNNIDTYYGKSGYPVLQLEFKYKNLGFSGNSDNLNLTFTEKDFEVYDAAGKAFLDTALCVHVKDERQLSVDDYCTAGICFVMPKNADISNVTVRVSHKTSASRGGEKLSALFSIPVKAGVTGESDPDFENRPLEPNTKTPINRIWWSNEDYYNILVCISQSTYYLKNAFDEVDKDISKADLDIALDNVYYAGKKLSAARSLLKKYEDVKIQNSGYPTVAAFTDAIISECKKLSDINITENNAASLKASLPKDILNLSAKDMDLFSSASYAFSLIENNAQMNSNKNR